MTESLPRYRASLARFEPAQWAALGKASDVGTHNWLRTPTVVDNWNRESHSNAGLDISQVPHGLVTVAWFWQCRVGHRWRETTAGITASSGDWAAPAPRWKRIGGSHGACRECVLEHYGQRYRECGHFDENLGRVSSPANVVPGWCPLCRGTLLVAEVGDAICLASPAPQTAAATFRRVLSRELGQVVAVHANAVITRHGPVFPTALVPCHRIAFTYRHMLELWPRAPVDGLKETGWEVIDVVSGGRSGSDAARDARHAAVRFHQFLSYCDPPR